MLEKYALEYSKKQRCFHIHTLESRKTASTNIDWHVLLIGSFNDCNNLRKNIVISGLGASNG